MLTVSETATTAFELPPAGPVAARCSRLIDLGSQESDYQGEKKMQRKILLSWELAELRADGTPFAISRRFGLSLHEKSALRAFLQAWRGRLLVPCWPHRRLRALRAFLQAWRGRPFTEEELAGFDLRRLLSAPCLLNIMHTSRNGKDYANIASISPLPKGMTAPDLAAPPVVFDIDAADAPAILETLSDNLQETIAGSPEWQARVATGGEPASAADPLDDDLAF